MVVEIIKIGIIITLIAIVISLAAAGFFLVRDSGRSRRVVKALTVRVTLSVILLVLILLFVFTGVLHFNKSPLALGQNINKDKQTQPHNVDEVPVP